MTPRAFVASLGKYVRRPAGATLDSRAAEAAREAAAVTERARLARDLHDGVLQTLAGTVFELESLRRHLPETSPVRERLLDIQMLIVAQQSELRALVEPLKDTALAPPVEAVALTARCRELGRRVERQWGQRVAVRTPRWRVTVPERTARQICHLLNEALVNAARHAGASRLAVELRVEHSAARIDVTDNGHGFPFRGQYDLKALDLMGFGPVTLRHHLRALGGNLVIDSTPLGSRVEMVLPLVADRDGR